MDATVPLYNCQVDIYVREGAVVGPLIGNASRTVLFGQESGLFTFSFTSGEPVPQQAGQKYYVQVVALNVYSLFECGFLESRVAR